MNLNATLAPSLVLALSLLPDAVLADACETVVQELQRLGGPKDVRIAPHGVTPAEYEKGLTNFAADLRRTDRMALAHALRDISISKIPGIHLRDLGSGSIHATIPQGAPESALAQRLDAELLKFALKKHFHRTDLRLLAGHDISHGPYTDSLEMLHLALEAKPAPEEFRKISSITVTQGKDIRATSARWSRKDGVLEEARLEVPADLMGAPDRIATAVLEAQAGEMLGDFGHTRMGWRQHHPDIPNAVVNGDVDETDYRNALRRLIGDPRWENGPETKGWRGPTRLARIVVTPAGEKATYRPIGNLFELHVPIDQLSLDGVLEASRLALVAPPGP